MPYVPPHLRGGGAAPPSGAGSGPSVGSSGGDAGGRSGYGGARPPRSDGPGGGGGDGFGGGAGRAMSRSQSTQSFGEGEGGGGGRGGRRGPTPAVFGVWQVSERVAALDEEQIKDIRQRLNVTVEIEAGQPPVISPIESFKEMVRMRGEPLPRHHLSGCWLVQGRKG